MIPNVKTAAIAAAVSLLVGFGAAWRVQDWRWTAAVAAQKIEAARQLAEAEAAREAREKSLAAIKDELEVKHETQRIELDRARDDLRRAAAAGRLRDPGRGPGGDCPVPRDSGAAGGAPPRPSETRLSDAAVEFLLDFAADADRAAEYARLCRDWIAAVRTGP